MIVASESSILTSPRCCFLACPNAACLHLLLKNLHLGSQLLDRSQGTHGGLASYQSRVVSISAKAGNVMDSSLHLLLWSLPDNCEASSGGARRKAGGLEGWWR